MAIDSRIALNLKPLNIGQRFGQNIQNLQQVDLLNQRRDLAPLQLQQAQRANELGIAQQPAQLQAAEFAASGQTQALLNADQVAKLDQFNAQALNTALASGNPQMVTEALNVQLQNAVKFNLADDIAEAQQALQMVNQEGGLQALQQATTAALTPISATTKSAGQREFENFVNIAQSPNSTQLEKDSANRALGNLAKVSTSAAERIAKSPDLANAIADVEGKVETAKETGKLKSQLKFKPQITKAVKLAEKAAIERGDTLTDLKRMEAALPGLNDAVDQLRELAKVATSTTVGRVFDFTAKELGFGGTKGATAKAKFISIIDNQVLPLLKPTFGGSFSIQEGESLKATLGDANASFEEKMATLDAFIDQKVRDIKTKKTQLNLPSAGNADVPETIDIGTASIEELIAERKRLGG